MAGQSGSRRQPVAPDANAQLRSGLRVGVSFQLDGADDFRIRDFRRQPIRHSHHAFPDLRNQEKYQFRYDLTHVVRRPRSQVRRRLHSRAGAERRVRVHGGAIHPVRQQPDCYITCPEPTAVVSRAIAVLHVPPARSAIPTQRRIRHHLHVILLRATAAFRRTSSGSPSTPRTRGAFRTSSRSTTACAIKRLAGLFEGSGRSQLRTAPTLPCRPCRFRSLPALPHDYRKQIAPRLGIAYSPGGSGKTVLRAGFGTVLRRSGSERMGNCIPGGQ